MQKSEAAAPAVGDLVVAGAGFAWSESHWTGDGPAVHKSDTSRFTGQAPVESPARPPLWGHSQEKQGQ